VGALHARRTVLQQIAGPQTTGGTQSYALKMFMRSLFQVPTGDMDDSDYQPKEPMSARPEAQERGRVTRTQEPRKTPEAPVRPVDGSPAHLPIPAGEDGPMVGRWTRMALDALADSPDREWRLRWLELHAAELAEVARIKPEYAAKVEGIARAPDAADQAAA
jgi:hypothetical protein